ncbi:MAG TPA: hypothetical protein VFA44_11440 [Gaiellaceae bacterium]|nr:hypothetical protein [Gaiellaceae bacterium]
MRSRTNRRRSVGWSVGAALAGAAVAAAVLFGGGVAGAAKHRIAAADQFLKAVHTPLKLRVGSDPAEVRYDISCLPPDGNAEGAGTCDGGGTVYFHSSTNRYAAVPLRLDTSADVGRYVAQVPSSIWSAPWFDYYAVVKDNSTGQTVAVPPGGSAAPQLSFLVGSAAIDLGTHVFGAVREPDAVVASAAWGTGPGEVGLEDGIDMPAGAASFDVDPSGTIYLLDEANSRMLEFSGGSAPTEIGLPGLTGVRADLKVDASAGRAYVLETQSARQPRPVLRTFTLQGAPVSVAPVADRAAAQVRLVGGTAYVSQYPSSLWAPVAQNDGASPVDVSVQLQGGVSGAPSPAGNVVVQSLGDEIRAGVYTGRGLTTQLQSSVRLLGGTHVADVQLAQLLPSGDLVLVFSVFTDSEHEYEVAVVDPSGALATEFSVPALEWAQSMPLSRFRLVGSSLYELGSTSAGIVVDRYDLGVS